jgi:SAM-dependent methyltransferase
MTQVQQKQRFTYKGSGIAPAFCRLARRYLKGPILDIGAGNGAVCKELKRRGYTYAWGIDLNPVGWPVDYGDCTDLAHYAQWSIRTVICTDVIEHLSDEDVERTFEEVWQVLPMGGHFIITTLNNEDLQANSVECPDCGCDFHRSGHIQSFDRERLSCMLQLAGFKVVDYWETNLTFQSKFPFLVTFFYLLGLHLLKPDKLFVKDLFIVARKEEKTFKSVFD